MTDSTEKGPIRQLARDTRVLLRNLPAWLLYQTAPNRTTHRTKEQA